MLQKIFRIVNAPLSFKFNYIKHAQRSENGNRKKF